MLWLRNILRSTNSFGMKRMNTSRAYIKNIATFFFLMLVSWRVLAESPVYLKNSNETKKGEELIFLFINEKGALESDSGVITFDELKKCFHQWRAHGVLPGVRLLLFPDTASNSDLRRIKGIIDFLIREKAPYDVMINPLGTRPGTVPE